MSGISEYLKARDFLLAHRDDYDFAYRNFRWPQLDEFNWALDYFDRIAAGNSHPALCVLDENGEERTLSFADVSKRSNQVARYLRRLGVRRGDRILLMLGNEVPLWETLLAAFKLGAVIVPAATLLEREDLRDRLERGQVRYVVVGAAHCHKFAVLETGYTAIAVGEAVPGWHPFDAAYQEPESFSADSPTRATDPLLLYFTSGTTAKPKLVLHSHQSYPVGHLSTLFLLGLQPGDLHWNISSPGWAKHAWSSLFAPWSAEACVFAYTYSRFSAKNTLGILAQKPITTLCAPPTVWRMLVQEDLAACSVRLRELISAGEPLNPEVIERVRAVWGITIRDGYGQTETTALMGNSPGQTIKPGSMGRPMPGYRVELLDLNGEPAGEGEICIDLSADPRGLMLGYAGEEVPSTADLRDRYYHTGDVGARDEDGYITFIGRVDDVFKASDYRISPFELESVLIRHAAVAEAAVVPSPDPVRTAVPKAFIALAPGYAPCEEVARSIFSFVGRNLAPYKRVRRLEFRELPKTISGKIRRAQLRKEEQARPASSESGRIEFEE
jgi:acetyl-CoA synthetase